MTDGIKTDTGLYRDSAKFDQKADADAPAYINIRDNGSMDTNFDWGKLGQDRIDAFVEMMTPMAEKQEQLTALLAEAEGSGDSALVAELQGMLDELEGKFQEIKDFVQDNNGRIDFNDPSWTSEIGKDGMFQGTIDSMMADFEVKLRKFDLEGITEGITSAADELGMSAEEFQGVVAAEPQHADIRQAEGTSSASSGSMSDADKYGTDLMKDPDQLVREFESNPEAFFEKVGEMSSHVQKGVMMKLQGEIQEDNQLFSMLTNFMKAMHDTEKAIIGNLRV